MMIAKELQTYDLCLYPMKRKAQFSIKPSQSSRPASMLIILDVDFSILDLEQGWARQAILLQQN